MFTVFFVMLLGVGIGIGLRSYPILKHTGILVRLVIFALLFLLGREVGQNPKIVDNLDTLGLQAILITLAGVAGSVLCSWLVYRLFFSKHER
ncbi:LysO family transporter [Sphingobacterium sp.]|uniref:LysO family transporter n=1 Tax=Sphingobacterium sp. TaxID=341027 RepID=UPI0031D96EEA